MAPSVVIACDRQADDYFGDGYTTVTVDVIRATTTAITAVAGGWRCFPVADLEAATVVANGLADPLLAGELGGGVPAGFEMDNSPAALVGRRDLWRPLVLLSSSGTRLMTRASRASRQPVYAACLRNYSAQAEQLVRHHRQHPRVALIGATSRGEFRPEDQLCCALLADALIRAGYQPLGATLDLVQRWSGVGVPAAVCSSNSAAFLRASGRVDDLEFILSHVDDLGATFTVRDGELSRAPAGDE
jgi:2-phosphosulfolactate phosphatase